MRNEDDGPTQTDRDSNRQISPKATPSKNVLTLTYRFLKSYLCDTEHEHPAHRQLGLHPLVFEHVEPTEIVGSTAFSIYSLSNSTSKAQSPFELRPGENITEAL